MRLHSNSSTRHSSNAAKEWANAAFWLAVKVTLFRMTLRLAIVGTVAALLYAIASGAMRTWLTP